MKVDIGEVLTRAWQITWGNKRLWWFGIFLSLFVLAIFPLFIIPMISFPLFLGDQRTDLFLLTTVGFVVIFFIFFILMYLVSALFQTAVTLGTIRASQEEEKIPLIELVRSSMPFYWRVLGVMSLYMIVVMLINFAIQVIMFFLAIATLGLGMLCATPLTMLQYPIMFVVAVWMEQAMNGIIIDKMNLTDAIKQGWQIVRNNLITLGLVVIVVYFGVGMISMIVVMPMMTTLFFMPLAFLEGDFNWMVVAVSVAISVIFIPFYALLSGWSVVFTKSTWVLTYLRLTRPIEPESVLQEKFI